MLAYMLVSLSDGRDMLVLVLDERSMLVLELEGRSNLVLVLVFLSDKMWASLFSSLASSWDYM